MVTISYNGGVLRNFNFILYVTLGKDRGVKGRVPSFLWVGVRNNGDLLRKVSRLGGQVMYQGSVGHGGRGGHRGSCGYSFRVGPGPFQPPYLGPLDADGGSLFVLTGCVTTSSFGLT